MHLMLMMMLLEQNQPFIKDCCMTRQLKLVEQSTLHTVKLSDELYFLINFIFVFNPLSL